MRLVIAALVLVACGDNLSGPPLEASDQVVVVAHQDDEHLFMQPDLYDSLRAQTPTTIVYVTAGDANSGLDFALSRINASKAAYGLLLDSQNWTCGWIEISEHWALSCRLDVAPLSLVFLGYPDGGISGQFPHSLLNLWEGNVDEVETVAEHTTTYDRVGLIATVAAILKTTEPTTIRTLEIAATHGDDHSDHMFVGSLTMLAALQINSEARLVSYRGYNINYEPATNPTELYDYVSLPMRSYEACMTTCAGGECGVTPCDTLDDQRYANFLYRRYAVAMRQAPLTGVLHADGGCLLGATLGDCTNAPVAELRANGLVAFGDQCLESVTDGFVLGPCTPAPNRTFYFDDEGHLYTGETVVAQPNLDTMHNLCVVGDGDGLRVDVCGSARDARWDLLQPTVTSPRVIASTSKGRAIRMADLTGDGLADLCFMGGTTLGLACRPGDGTGHFGAPVSIGATNFAIEAQSLALGDIDGDGRADACGRNASGIVCATAASGWKAKRWASAFANSGPTTATDQSLAIIQGSVCGATTGGVICARGDVESVLSTWTAANATDAPAWPADLDGDDRPDWCVATAGGAQCGLAAEAEITDDGVAWGFSNHAALEGSVAVDGSIDDVVHAAIADVSGDGRADMCVAVHSNVECAISQGHGFGPRHTMIVMPSALPIVGLWLGDLDGDGKADACADDGTSITCALSP